MKKQVTHLPTGLLCMLACLLTAVPAMAQVNYAVSGGAAYVDRSPNASGDIVIASTYSGYPVTSISERAFWPCTSLTSVTIPNSVTNIGWGAFYRCTNLTNVVLGNGVTSLGSWAFYGCTGLRSVAIPDSVTTIWNDVFYFCTGVTNVVIGNSVTSIGDGAFYYCASLTGVTIPNSVTNIGGAAFFGCTSLASVVIGNSVTSLGSSAFYNCTSLTNVVIGNSFMSIGGGAFLGCTSLTEFLVDADNPAYSSLNGVLFDKAETTLILFPPGRTGRYVIPDDIISIEAWAFYGCASLVNVTIPESVTTIERETFGGCTSLTSVTIPDSVTYIEQQAFWACTSLKSVVIGNSVIYIGGRAFEFCMSLTDFTFLGDAPSLAPDFGGSNNPFSGVGVGARVYYYSGTTRWGATYGGLPTVMLSAPRIAPGSAGMKPGGFGFTLTRLTNQTIVVEASTNLLNWQPVWTNALLGGSAEFVDPQSLQHPARFYRARSN